MELIDDEFSEKGIKEEDIDDDGLIFEEVILDPFGWRGIGSWFGTVVLRELLKSEAVFRKVLFEKLFSWFLTWWVWRGWIEFEEVARDGEYDPW